MRLRDSGEPTAFWLMFMNPRSRIYRIDSARAATAFVRAYADDHTDIAWERVADDWDAVWLAEPGDEVPARQVGEHAGSRTPGGRAGSPAATGSAGRVYRRWLHPAARMLMSVRAVRFCAAHTSVCSGAATAGGRSIRTSPVPWVCADAVSATSGRMSSGVLVDPAGVEPASGLRNKSTPAPRTALAGRRYERNR